MKTQLETQGFDLTDAIAAHVDRQLAFHLSSFEHHVLAVDVFLRDINGPKGGPDKKVLIRAQLATGKPITVEHTRSDLYTAVTQAARQAKRAVKRALGKHRRMEKLTLREMRQYPQV